MISKGISSLDNNIGLAILIGAVYAAVGKGIAKSSLPPIQKAGVKVAAAIAGAGIHVGASAINIKNNIIS